MAPKKNQAQKGSGPKKPTTAVPDSDYVVFTNDQSSKTKKEAKQEPLAPPRPDVRKVIGGASWTGKLPVNLLSEHCQRQKWNKPDYSMRKMPEAQGGGYRSSVTLSMTNPKTRETTTIQPFHLPRSHEQIGDQPTALEARHFAATYGLFRIASMKNLHMTLPPQYRDLWKGLFAQLKQEDVDAGRAWKYDADPFAAEAKRQEILVDMEKRKEEKAKNDAKIALGLVMPSQMSGGQSKAWERATRVELGTKSRMAIEDLVQHNSIWNQYGVPMAETERRAIVNDLGKLGFRRSHIEEAVIYCKDREETLEWLLIHVPEDDLPPWSFPPGYSTGVSLASGDIVREAKIKRLSVAGFSSDMCAKALLNAHGDEGLAAEALQNDLLPPPVANSAPHEETDSETVWQEEMMTLKATLDDNFFSSEPDVCSIQIQTKTPTVVKVHFRKPHRGYPVVSVPVISIEADKLPCYIRLSASRKALVYAYETLLGDMMIYSLVEWLETNIALIIENPGPLHDLETPQASHTIIQPRQNGPAASPSRTRKLNTRSHGAAVANEDIFEQWKTRQATAHQIKMIMARQNLPAWSKQKAIVDAVNQRNCVIISGETGSGKSTQAVQFILDDMISNLKGHSVNILCTQPRRISALGLSERVSNERCSIEGSEVGYVIRGESKVSSKTKITFMTTGVLLRRLQSALSLSDALADVTHVFVDEVHERNLDTDFLLALLRDTLQIRKDLKVVLMSATLDANVFSNYFGGPSKVGLVEIEGRTFPVHDHYLDEVLRLARPDSLTTTESYDRNGDEDAPNLGGAIQALGMGINYALIADLVRHIDTKLGTSEGGILIFLPGTLEIDRCLRALQDISRLYPLPLHASLLPEEQRRVFPPAPRGKRKVIAATNVAETSITIEDIVAVIDTGRVKETNYDVGNNIVRLEEVWSSKAACKQRRGRAGRVQEGTCYKLFTRNVEASMASRPEPEIRRVPLEQLCLSVKASGVESDVEKFLANTLTPPDSGAVSIAMSLLHAIGALESSRLTALGTYLAMIPADLRCAKLLVYGSIFGCLEASLTIAAILTLRSPFVSPRDKRDEAKEARATFSTGHGDLLVDLAAYDEWSQIQSFMRYREIKDWCSTNFLSLPTLRDIASTRSQLLNSLKDAGLVPLSYSSADSESITNSLNEHNTNHLLLRSLIAASLHPQTLRIDFPDKKYIASMSGAKEIDPEAKTIKYFTKENGRVFVHPSSILFDAQSYGQGSAYLSYFNKMATGMGGGKVFVRDLTPFNPYTLLLFGGPIELDTTGHGLIVDGWLRLRGWARIGVLVSRLRTLLDDALRRRIDAVSTVPSDQTKGDGEQEEEEVLRIVRRLVILNGQDQ